MITEIRICFRFSVSINPRSFQSFYCLFFFLSSLITFVSSLHISPSGKSLFCCSFCCDPFILFHSPSCLSGFKVWMRDEYSIIFWLNLHILIRLCVLEMRPSQIFVHWYNFFFPSNDPYSLFGRGFPIHFHVHLTTVYYIFFLQLMR